MTTITPPPDRVLVYSSSPASYLQWPTAAPDDNLDYGLNLARILSSQGDAVVQISASAAPSGIGELSIPQVYAVEDLVVVWLGGGVPSRVYQVRVDVLTTDGREYSIISKLVISGDTLVPPAPSPPSAGFGAPTTWSSGGIIIGPPSIVATDLVGVGTNQATALPLQAFVNIVSSAPTGTGFILPANAGSGVFVVQIDDPTNNGTVYPPVGGQINSLGVNAPFIIGSMGGRINFSTNSPATQWYAA